MAALAGCKGTCSWQADTEPGVLHIQMQVDQVTHHPQQILSFTRSSSKLILADFRREVCDIYHHAFLLWLDVHAFQKISKVF